MSRIAIVGVLLFAFSRLGLASVLEFNGPTNGKVEASGQAVSLYPEAKIKIPQATNLPTLKLTGAGVRTKKVVLVKVNVYVAASYVDGQVKLDPANPMAGVRQAKAKALQLTFLRDVDAAKIRNSFSDALKKNGVDVKSPLMQDLLGKLSFDVKEKGTLTLVGYSKADKNEVLYVESEGNHFSVEGPDLASNFWQIWFGEPEDGGLESLKVELARGKAS